MNTSLAYSLPLAVDIFVYGSSLVALLVTPPTLYIVAFYSTKEMRHYRWFIFAYLVEFLG